MYVILTGAKKNIGDFLIGARAKALLKKYVSEDIVELDRFQSLNQQLDTVNQAAAVILCGGPAYASNIYPGVYPLVEDLEQLKPPVIPFGLGWCGKPQHHPENFRFTDRSLGFLKKIHADIPFSSCRDNVTLSVLNSAGLNNVKMTGCPVWYHIPSLEKKFKPVKEIKRIVFTTPDNPKLILQVHALLRMIRKLFPKAEVISTFHRGIKSDKYTSWRAAAAYELMCQIGKYYKCENRDVSYDLDRIEFYGDCDLHVGYRVHAHLDFLSRRLPSILINEDGRGVGMIRTMNLPEFNVDSPDLLGMIEQELRTMLSGDFSKCELATQFIDENFKIMHGFLQQLKSMDKAVI